MRYTHMVSRSSFGELEEQEKRSRSIQPADETLHETELWYRSLVETMNDGLLVRDENEIITYVNERLCQILGYGPEELVGHHLPNFFDKAGQVLFHGESTRRRKGESEPYEITWTGKGGKKITVIMSPKPIFDAHGRFKGSFAVITDITRRKEAEEALLKAHEELEEKVRERTAELASLNRQLQEEISERKRTEAELSKHRRHLELLFAERTTELSKANALLQLEACDRKRANELLRKANQQLQNIIDFLPDATFVIDKDRKVIAWNRAIEQMTGVNKQNIVGKGDYAYAIPFYGERRPMLIDLVMSEVEGIEQYYDFVERGERGVFGEAFVPNTYQAKGAYLWGTASALCDDKGRVTGAIQSIRDISERKNVEEALRQNEEKYRQLLETVSDAILVFDAETQGVVDINESAIHLYGYTREDFHTLKYSDIVVKSSLVEISPKETPSAKPIKISLRYDRKKDGTVFPVELSSASFVVGGRKVRCEVIRDITGRIQAEQELARYREDLEESVKDRNAELGK